MNVSLRRNRNPNNYACNAMCATINIDQRLVYRKTYLSMHTLSLTFFLCAYLITTDFKKYANRAKGSTFTVIDHEADTYA